MGDLLFPSLARGSFVYVWALSQRYFSYSLVFVEGTQRLLIVLFLFLRHVGWAVGAELNMPYLACGCLRSHPYIFIELLKLFLYIMCPFLILPYVAFFFLFFVLQLVCVPPQKPCCRVWGRSGECDGAEIHSSCLRLQGCDQKRDVSQQIFCRVLQLLIGPVTMCGAKCEALLGILK